jgi:glycosyltransferase involved in cell wall biosynthesis
MLKITLVTNIPAPYRIPVFNILAEKYGKNFTVIYCAKTAPNRNWDLPEMEYNHLFLNQTKTPGYIHNNINIFKHFKKIKPDIIISTGFNPTFLYAFLWSLFCKKKHIPMTDGTAYSESFLTWKHRAIRKFVYKNSAVYIGASKGSFELYKSYNIEAHKIFKSCLCIDNEKFAQAYKPPNQRNYDIMFSGQFKERKNPFFFADVAKTLKKRKHNLKVLIIGAGPLQNALLKKMREYKIDFDFPGFISQKEIPEHYANSKILLFPTMADPWGVIANEACAVRTPVIVSENAGVSGELIIDGINGFVLPLDSNLWAKKASDLLGNPELWDKMSKSAGQIAQKFNFQSAAEGIISACNTVYNKKSMKIVVMSTFPPPYYGSAMSSEMCLNILKEYGNFEPIRIKTNYSRSMEDIGRLSGRKILGFFSVLFKIVKVTRTDDIQIVYFVPTVANIGMVRDFLCYKILRICYKGKMLIHLRGRLFYKNFSIKKYMLKTMLNNNSIIFLDKTLESETEDLKIRKKTYILPNAVKNEIKEPELEIIYENRLRSAKIRILFLSNMHKSKGWFTLLEACSILARKNIPFQCVFAGSWLNKSNRQIFDDYVAQNNLTGDIKHVGFVDSERKRALLLESDVLVFPTIHDTFPRVIIEAMHYGLPVISNPIAAIKTAVQHGETGYLLKNSTPEEIVDYLEVLYNDRNKAIELGKAGRKRFLKYYEIETFKKNFISIVKSA